MCVWSQIAKMHMHQPERHQFFGFGVPTLLGNQRADNGFLSDWSTFFVERRLVPVLDQVGRAASVWCEAIQARPIRGERIVRRAEGVARIRRMMVVWRGEEQDGAR